MGLVIHRGLKPKLADGLLRRFAHGQHDHAPGGFKGGVVVVDNVLASYRAARHLIELGHQHIAIIAGPETTLTGSGRIEGFRRALQEAHLPLREEYIRPGAYSTEGGYRAALEILQLPNPPTAVFACNNRMTMGLMGALKDLGLNCPQDVSVLGFDDFDWSELFSPRLTIVVQPSYEMGELATEMLLQVIKAPDQHLESGEGNRIILKAEVRVRESTAPPASCSGRPQQNSIPLIPRSSAATEPAASRPPEQSSVMEGQIPRLGNTSESRDEL
jgi:LacI family transcriptional regulator